MRTRYSAFKVHPLTQDAPLFALVRYIKFNVSQILYLKPRIYPWINNLSFYAQKGDAGIVANIYYKLFDYEDSMFLIDKLKENELFVDIGANVGHFSLIAAGICKSNVIAFEPIPETFMKLEKNIILNKLNNKIRSYNIGIGDNNAVLNFTRSKNVMNAVAMTYETDVVAVEVKRLDDVLLGYNPTFLKIDVEGYEYFVLKGSTEVLKNKMLKYIIIELNSSTLKFGHSNEEIFEFLVELDFVPIAYDVFSKTIIPQPTFNTNKFNTIFARKDYLK